MNDFPQATFEMWRARAGDVEKLVSHTADGIRIEPLYQQSKMARTDRGMYGPWHVLQRVDHPDPLKAHAQALEDLENGANGLALARDFDARLLGGIALHAIDVRLEGGAELAKAFAAHVAVLPIDPARLSVSFGLKEEALVKDLLAQGFAGPFMEADGRAFHNQGATEAQELACVLSELVGGLRKSVPISATLAANQDFFLTLAKFRAVRLLWARVLEASGMPFQALRVHGETSLRMMARLDPHTNMLRATAAVFGAGLGGTDSFTVLPFSIQQGLPNAFARRMARNTQLILVEEAQLWRVSNAASGAGFLESLTHDLCEKAWEIFQGIEKTGELPIFNFNIETSDPIIGTKAYQLPQEYEAAVEALP